MKILKLATAEPQGSCQCDAFLAEKACLPSDPSAAELPKRKAIAEEILRTSSLKPFRAGEAARFFFRPSGTIQFTPIQKTLRNVKALCVQCPTPGDERQGASDLATIEAKSYATGFFSEDAAYGR